MSAFSLAQLLTVLQDNLQRSYDHVEDLVELNRADGEAKVEMAVSEMEVSLPVQFKIVESKLDAKMVLDQVDGLSAHDISMLRIDTPSTTPKLREAIKAQMHLANFRDRTAATISSAASDDKPVKRSASKELQAINRDIMELKQVATREMSKQPRITRDLQMRTLGEKEAIERSGEVGRLVVKFKATLK